MSDAPSQPAITYRTLDADAAESRLDELATLLVDAVANGASVNFVAGFTHDDARAFWRSQFAGIANGEKYLFVADDGDRIVGSAMLTPATQPNAPHRADVTKMLVHSAIRQRGVGRALLREVENAARNIGRSLLVLDTETDSAGEALYRRCGWIEYGRLPDHSLTPGGRLASATFFYKRLD